MTISRSATPRFARPARVSSEAIGTGCGSCAKFECMVHPADKGRSEFSSHMGMESLGMIDGAATVQLDLAPIHMSRANRVHGGVLFTLLDSALGRAILYELPMGRGCATVEIKINYFRPVQSGRVIARGWKRELTKSLGYAEGEVVNEEGKVLARATGTFFLTKSMRQDDRERV